MTFTTKNYIKNHYKLGWINKLELYNPENPYLRVISHSHPISVRQLFTELTLIPLKELYLIPDLIFKNRYTRAFHIHTHTTRYYLNLNINKFDGIVTLCTKGIVKYPSQPKIRHLLTKEYTDLYGAIRVGTDIYYIYAGKIIQYIDKRKLTSLELMTAYDEAHAKLKYLAQKAIDKIDLIQDAVINKLSKQANEV